MVQRDTLQNVAAALLPVKPGGGPPFLLPPLDLD